MWWNEFVGLPPDTGRPVRRRAGPVMAVLRRVGLLDTVDTRAEPPDQRAAHRTFVRIVGGPWGDPEG